MKLKITQNSVGRFNLMGNEESLSFYMGIVDDEGKTITEGENKAQLHYSGEPGEQDDFSDNAEDIGWIFGKCYGYSKRVFGSTDYQGNAELFARIYREHFDELSANWEAQERVRLESKMARLKEQLEGNLGLLDAREEVREHLEKEAQKYDKWADSSEAELAQYVEGSEKAIQETEKVSKYRAKATLIRASY